MTSTEVIQFVYDRFKARDVAGVLSLFEDQIEFRLAEGHPYNKAGTPWIGKEQIVQNFFMKAGAEWEEWTVACDQILSAGETVIVEGRYHGIYKATGRRMDLQACHVWKVRNGLIASFHQYLDTARLQWVTGETASS